MKNQLYKPYLFLFLVMLSPILLAQNVEKTKVISEKYNVNSADKLKIDNRFGKININTSAKNEITVLVTIRAWGKNEEKANEMLAKASIKHQKNGNLIDFETQIVEGNININDRNGLEVVYEVNMPINNALEIYNKYGNVFLADFSGELDLEVKYGQLNAQKLTGVNKNIKIAYGNCDISEIERGDLHITYGKGYIGKATTLKLYNAYANMNFDQVGDLITETKYGGIEIDDQLNSISGTMAYSNFKTEKLIKSLVLDVKYAGGFKVENISSTFEKIDVMAAYCSVTLEFEANPNFDFEIKTKYGNMSSELKNIQFKREIEESHSKEYEGSVGKGGGKVNIEAKYGNVKLEQ